jgi:hypothetical protein
MAAAAEILNDLKVMLPSPMWLCPVLKLHALAAKAK